MKHLLNTALTALLCACQQPGQPAAQFADASLPPHAISSTGATHAGPSSPSLYPGDPNPYPTVGSFPLPPGYHRLPADSNPFASWLRALPLKRDRTVYLYDGSRKRNQQAQFAVLDISVGHTDLQQCADAVMRLRAEFLYARHDLIDIDFYTEQGTRLNFQEWANGGRVRLTGAHLTHYTIQTPDHYCESRACFNDYLKTVFSWCGTHTLEKQLLPRPLAAITPGDVFIKGGSPGHAMILMDVAEDAKGHRIYLLAQSYMPAQDIHIVINPLNPTLSPWYDTDTTRGLIETPEWTFTISQLRMWPRHIGKT